MKDYRGGGRNGREYIISEKESMKEEGRTKKLNLRGKTVVEESRKFFRHCLSSLILS